MKLYDFRDWSKKNRAVELTELESNETLFKEEFSKIKKGWTVVDVGARVGYYTIKAGLLVGSEGKVLAIEPHPQIFQVLRMNIELYKLDNIIPVCKSVGDETRMVKLFESYDSGGTSIISPPSVFSLDRDRLHRWFRLIKKGDFFKLVHAHLNAHAAMYVSLDTLDRIMKEKNLEKVDLIKIDVQGAEFDVLKGSHDILERSRPRLLVEVHPELAHLQGWKPEDLYELLHNYGYRLAMHEQHNKPMIVAQF